MGVTKELIKEGTGPAPTAGQTVTVHCTGYLATNPPKQFWTTRDSQPFSFKVGVGKVIRGWDEGVLQMQLGELSRLHISGDYAYGPRGFPAWGIGANQALIFEIELLKVE